MLAPMGKLNSRLGAALIVASVMGLVGCATPSIVGPVEAESDWSRPNSTPTPPPAAEEEPTAEFGSRENPIPYGTVVPIEDTASGDLLWEITVNQPTNETAAIAAENQFNDAPANGAYLAVPVHAVWQGAEPITPWVDWENGLEVAYVSADGRTFEEASVVQPWPQLMDIADLYEGGAADFYSVFDVPADVTGLVRVSVGGFDFFVGTL